MAEKKSGAPKRKTPDQKSAKAKGKGELSEKDLGKVAGGMRPRGESEQCKETSDSGTMGCPG